MCGIIVISIIVIYYYINSTKEIYEYENLENTILEEEKIEEEQNTIIIHITGAVQKQGIVEVKENARINDVINAAGGLTKDADINSVNLAYEVEDGQKIYIPYLIELEENVDDGEIIMQSAGINVVEEDKKIQGKININQASLGELQVLPGVGEATAQKIINYRNENGKFKSIEDIQNVSGIGTSKYEMIKDLISI